jgi:CRP-like cAMP-binding protein
VHSFGSLNHLLPFRYILELANKLVLTVIMMKPAIICEILAQNFSNKKEFTTNTTGSSQLCPLLHCERVFSRGELIYGPYAQEEKVYVIKEGVVEIYQLSLSGKRVIIDIMEPGGIFTNSAFCSERVATNDFAKARSTAVLCVLRKSDFMDVLEQTPILAAGLIEELAVKLHEADGRIRNLILSDARTRLVGELLRFGSKVGKEYQDKTIIETKLTHKELAEIAGVARETVSRLLKGLREDMIVLPGYNGRIVIDRNRAENQLVRTRRAS